MEFVLHLINLSKSVWNNLKAKKTHCNLMISNMSENKTKKLIIKGFLNLWKEGIDGGYISPV